MKMSDKENWITDEEIEVELTQPREKSIKPLLHDPGNDYYGDYHAQKQGFLTGGLYHYLITESYIKTLIAEGMSAVPPTDSVVNVNLMPYANYAQFDYLSKQTLFDTNRFPPSGQLKNNITLCRCSTVKYPVANLATFKRYDSTLYQQKGGKFNWKKETKLQQYPYSYIEFRDNVSTPLMIDPSSFQFGDTNTQTLKVRHHLNHLGMYALFVAGYKGDSDGLIEGVVTQGLSLPTTSSAYMDYMARNQHQFKQNQIAANIQMGSTVVQGIAGLLSTDAGGNVADAINSGINASLQIANLQAQERDLKSSPNTLKNAGGDVMFNYQASDKKMWLYRYRLNDETCERLGWYFHMFGYKQNKIMIPNLKSRKRYNYVKTIQANIKTSGIPKVYAEKLSSIFNGGVTIWHVDNNITIKDYSYDNEEVA